MLTKIFQQKIKESVGVGVSVGLLCKEGKESIESIEGRECN